MPEKFSITSTLDAPRDLVWRAWTERERLMSWFGPTGFAMPVATLDLRPGGNFHYCLVGPDGAEMWGKFVFREISKPQKIVLVNSFSDSHGGLARHPLVPTWPMQMLSTKTLIEKGDKTVLTIEWSPIDPTAEERATFEGAFAGMQQGWSGTLAQLAAYVAAAKNSYDREIISVRTINVPLAKNFEAWSKEENLRQWYGPNGFSLTTQEFAFKPGGDWKFTFHGPDGKNYENHAVYKETSPNKIVLEHVSAPHFILTVTFEEIAGKTKITFRQLFDSAAVCESIKPICVPSNEQNFDRLEKFLGTRG